MVDANDSRKSEIADIYQKLTSNFRKHCDDLLVDDTGLQLHIRVDMNHVFNVHHLGAQNRVPVVVPKNPCMRKQPRYIRVGASI